MTEVRLGVERRESGNDRVIELVVFLEVITRFFIWQIKDLNLKKSSDVSRSECWSLNQKPGS